jgi:hypothetical protein
MDQAAAHAPGRRGAGGARLAARDQVRRLPYARSEGGKAKLLTRTGLDWSHRYRRTIEALRGLDENSTELLFNLMQLPSGDKNQRPSYEAAAVWLCR